MSAVGAYQSRICGCGAVWQPTHGGQRRCEPCRKVARQWGFYGKTALTARCQKCGRERRNPRSGDLCRDCARGRRTLVPCPRCGGEFWPWANGVKHARKFCCKAPAKPKPKPRVCLTPEQRREANRIRSKQRYLANRDAQIARVSAYKKRHPNKNNDWSHRRRARLIGGFMGPVDLGAVKASRKSCLYCLTPVTPETAQADHVIAIALGGEHTMRNLVAACASCNGRKRDRPLVEWLGMLAPERRSVVERLCAERGLVQPLLPLKVRVIKRWRCGCIPGESTCEGHTPKTRKVQQYVA